MSTLSIKHLVKEYVPGKPVLKDISLDIEAVSYTHLDVYKRQVVNASNFHFALRLCRGDREAVDRRHCDDVREIKLALRVLGRQARERATQPRGGRGHDAGVHLVNSKRCGVVRG